MSKHDPIIIDTVIIPTGDNLSHQRVEQVAKKLQIRERAIESGQKNEPASDATDLDETQQTIIREGDHYTLAMARRAKTEIADRENEIRQTMPLPLNTLIEEANIHRQVADTTNRHKDALDQAHQAKDLARRALRGFEESNKLPPESAVYDGDWTMFISILLTLILIESAANGYFLQELGDRGWLGGFSIAVGISVINVMLAFITGFVGWRLIPNVKPLRRMIGWAVTIVGMILAFALLLALADLREAVSHDFNARVDFLTIFDYRKWFRYTTFPPFILLVGGVLIFLITAFKARGGRFGPVAPYWEHEEFDRRHKTAREIVLHAENDLQNSIQDAYNGELSKVRERHAADEIKLDGIRRIAAHAHQITRVLTDSIREEIARVAIWLKLYRDTNRAVRTIPAPAYFYDIPDLQEWYARRLDLAGVDGLVTQAEEIVDANASKLAALQEKLIHEQTQVLARVAAHIDANRERATTTTPINSVAPINADAGRNSPDGDDHE